MVINFLFGTFLSWCGLLNKQCLLKALFSRKKYFWLPSIIKVLPDHCLLSFGKVTKKWDFNWRICHLILWSLWKHWFLYSNWMFWFSVVWTKNWVFVFTQNAENQKIQNTFSGFTNKISNVLAVSRWAISWYISKVNKKLWSRC